ESRLLRAALDFPRGRDSDTVTGMNRDDAPAALRERLLQRLQVRNGQLCPNLRRNCLLVRFYAGRVAMRKECAIIPVCLRFLRCPVESAGFRLVCRTRPGSSV